MKVVILSLFVLIGFVQGHGRMRQPPQRGTAWRYGFKTPPNYDDNGLNCGGLSIQQKYGMKCGICGDSYGDPRPRPHENGGKYGTGTIVATYKAGQTVNVQIELTANHLGYFVFDLCELNGGTELEECFGRLRLASGVDREPVFRDKNNYIIPVVLPSNVHCEQCVLRWVYVAGNNWGNSDQEHFVNCADVKIM